MFYLFSEAIVGFTTSDLEPSLSGSLLYAVRRTHLPLIPGMPLAGVPGLFRDGDGLEVMFLNSSWRALLAPFISPSLIRFPR